MSGLRLSADLWLIHLQDILPMSDAALKILIIVPHYWGKGDTIDEAWAQVKKSSYKNLRDLKSGPHGIYVVWDTDEVKTHVNEMGSIFYPSNHKYTRIHHKLPK
jgi:hypothetical protein